MKKEPGNNSQFFDDLRTALNPEHQPNIEYLYGHSEDGNRRWNNLVSYLGYMEHEQPDILLIGEAPGYRGTTVSGVPFLSEQMIVQRAADKLKLPLNDFEPAPSNEMSGYEATSTAMWSTLDKHSAHKLPLLWATVPNHPHMPETTRSNRRPASREIQPYFKIIDTLVAKYAIKQVVAIGGVAYDTLTKNGYDNIVKIRHPARGGARKFDDGYNHLMEQFYGEH